VHPADFRIEGFTAAVGVPELAELAEPAETHGVPVVFDIGSGLLAPHPLLPGEPSAATALLAKLPQPFTATEARQVLGQPDGSRSRCSSTWTGPGSPSASPTTGVACA
jgi:hypothetical protein